jgi:hypothetical protein
MDISGIISVSGMGGLFKIVAQSRNGIIVESLLDGKRMPIYASHKVSALEDISMYSTGEDVPLAEVFTKIKNKQNNAQAPFDSKTENVVIRDFFKEAFPEHDEERIFVSDMKKVIGWYNLLLEKGFLDKTPEADNTKSTELKQESGPVKPKIQTGNKALNTAAPKASTKGMTKTATVRKTGG